MDLKKAFKSTLENAVSLMVERMQNLLVWLDAESAFYHMFLTYLQHSRDAMEAEIEIAKLNPKMYDLVVTTATDALRQSGTEINTNNFYTIILRKIVELFSSDTDERLGLLVLKEDEWMERFDQYLIKANGIVTDIDRLRDKYPMEFDLCDVMMAAGPRNGYAAGNTDELREYVYRVDAELYELEATRLQVKEMIGA